MVNLPVDTYSGGFDARSDMCGSNSTFLPLLKDLIVD